MRSYLLLPLVVVAGLLAGGCVVAPSPSEPELCQPGTFSASGAEPCTPAPVGKFVDIEGATEATTCPVGKYQDEVGQTSCKDAEPGSFVARTGAAAATLCPLGRFQPSSGATSCLLAPVGTVVDTVGAAAATDCPPGTTTEFAGSTSLADCVAAPAVLVVAYTNLDGVGGYDERGSDVLIAKLVDTNDDGVVSVGDAVETNQYPLDLGAAGFGAFQSTVHPVTVVDAASPAGVQIQDSDNSIFVFTATTTSESYYEYGFRGTVLLNDYWIAAGNERVSVDTGAPSLPDTAAFDLRTPSNGLDDPYIDVDSFVPEPTPPP